MWEPAAPGERGGPATGGLAFLARDGRRVARIPTCGHHTSRWLHAAVEAQSGRPLHFAAVYGYHAGQPRAAEKNTMLFQDGGSRLAAA